MAKAKKPDAGEKTTAKKKPGGGKAAAGKKSAAAGSQAPQIDTNLAASAAAAMILNRAVTGGGSTGGGTAPPAAAPAQRQESAGFKHLKQNLNKPAAGGLGGVLGSVAQQKKATQNYGGGKQVGRNQTFGADVNRTGVPRRTGGG
jgi:hypothetical protein